MITITKNTISEWLLLDVYSEIHIAKEKIQYFEKKYKKSYIDFETELKNSEEDFKKYDDYIEWKSYLKIMSSAQKKIDDIKNGNIEIS